MTIADWRPVELQLDRFEEAGRHVRFWLRDDDAVEPTAALDRLIDLCNRHRVPLLLAVIPEPATEGLAKRIDGLSLIQPCQHGFSHRNHAAEGQRACELGGIRPMATVLDDLARGQARLHGLFGQSLRPILVPPWNRIDPALAPHLPSAGFQGLSTFGRKPVETEGSLIEINAHLDIINWRQGRIGRDHTDLIGKLVAELEFAFDNDAPTGVLGHHLVHDEIAWGFLEDMLAMTGRHSCVRWISTDELLGDRARNASTA